MRQGGKNVTVGSPSRRSRADYSAGNDFRNAAIHGKFFQFMRSFINDHSAVRREIAARPKSSTLTAPSGVTTMFYGFRSRWIMPRS